MPFPSQFNGHWYQLKKYENDIEKSYDCGHLLFKWDGNKINASMCEKRFRSYQCFHGDHYFAGADQNEAKFYYIDHKFREHWKIFCEFIYCITNCF